VSLPAEDRARRRKDRDSPDMAELSPVRMRVPADDRGHAVCRYSIRETVKRADTRLESKLPAGMGQVSRKGDDLTIGYRR